MWQRVLGVASRVDLRTFESPAFQDRLMRVQTSALSRPYQVTQGLLTAMGALAACVVLGITLVTISPWLLPLVAAAGIPMTLVSRSESRLEFAFSVRSTPLVRLRGYFALLLSGREEAKEVRAFGLGPWLRGRFDGLYAEHLVNLRRHAVRVGLLGLLGQIASALALGSALVAIVWMVDSGALTIAAAGAGIVAVRFLSTQVQALFGGLRSIFESGLFLADLDIFLRHAQAPSGEEDGAIAPAGFGRIETSDLTFSYPGSTTPALAGIDITLHAGEVVALVGENGSGKTTLAKLLAGLYRPDGGRITWDGQDTAGFSATSLRERVTVLFQDFVRYALSATDNIRIGRIADPIDPARISAATAGAGTVGFLERLPNGLETPLSPIFEGGADLSGGQWQRVALARALYRDAPLVILDEPSAALDPRAEHELFAALRASLRGRTALFISHRFSTVRGADRIYVLDAGRVVEEGTHDTLVARGGRYAELFRLQSEAYVTGQAPLT
jgi:ATP-binding cassette subfamily B protein